MWEDGRIDQRWQGHAFSKGQESKEPEVGEGNQLPTPLETMR